MLEGAVVLAALRQRKHSERERWLSTALLRSLRPVGCVLPAAVRLVAGSAPCLAAMDLMRVASGESGEILR